MSHTRIRLYILTLILTLFSASMMSCSGTAITPIELNCEYAENPLIDIQNPRLSWINENTNGTQGAAQTAYQIRVAVNTPDFDNPVWDSGKVDSDESAFILYEGVTLQPRTNYYWQVKVWDQDGKESAWSKTSQWHVGILSADEWKGKWIGAPWQGNESYDIMYPDKEFQYIIENPDFDADPAPLIRKPFSITKPVKEVRFYGTAFHPAPGFNRIPPAAGGRLRR